MRSKQVKQVERVIVTDRRDILVFLTVVAVLGAMTILGTRPPVFNSTIDDNLYAKNSAAPLQATGAPVLTTVAATVAATTAATTTVTAAPSSAAAVVESGTKFEIGEHLTAKRTSERSSAKELVEQAKKARNTVTENAMGAALAEQGRKAKQALDGKENLRGEYPDVLEQRMTPSGFGTLIVPVGREDPPMIATTMHVEDTVYAKDRDMLMKNPGADARQSTLAYSKGRSYAKVQEDYANDMIVKNRLGFSNHVYTPKLRSWSGDVGWNGFYGWKSTENAMASDLGDTSHSFANEGPNGGQLTNGIGKEDWQRQGTDWANVKSKLLVTVRNICGLFDRLFAEELFPDAIVDPQNNGQVYIRDGKEGRCIRVDRYFEYVQSSIISQLSLGKVEPLPWARSVQLGFDAIESAKGPLKSALISECGRPDSSFILGVSGRLATAKGKDVSVILPWPKDQTVLYVHPMHMKTPGKQNKI